MIPVIDISPLVTRSNQGVETVAGQLFDAYSTVGFAQLVNHGVPDDLIHGMFSVSRQFHALPQASKDKVRFGHALRGYLPVNTSTLKKSELGAAKKPNQSESFFLLNEMDPSDPWDKTCLGGKNVWPADLPDFKPTIETYYRQLSLLSLQLIGAFSVALGLPQDYLNQYFSNPNVFLRLLCYYPPATADVDPDTFGSAPHTDYGCITLLQQDDAGGLQVQYGDQWIDVVPIPNAFVLNIGQMMALWSNGQLKATRHRVVIDHLNASPRLSIPFFYNCNLETVVAPLSDWLSNDPSKNAEPVRYGEHLEQTLRQNYAFTA